jgi:hypothetical protein
MADHVRSYTHPAYSWGMKSDNDYRRQSPRRFRIPFKPATGIPTEPKALANGPASIRFDIGPGFVARLRQVSRLLRDSGETY